MKPGDVVVAAFAGADATKIRPAVVLSTELYHHWRPDVIIGLITTRPPKEMTPTDCVLHDWRQEGLRRSSYFRLFAVTLPQREVRMIGRLSESDLSSVRECLSAGFGSA